MRVFSRVRVEKVPGDEPYVFAVHTMPEHGSVKEEGMLVCSSDFRRVKFECNVLFFLGRLIVA